MSQPSPPEPVDDPKEQMRLALERKKKAQHDTAGTGRGPTSTPGKADPHPHGGKREFRRKSG